MDNSENTGLQPHKLRPEDRAVHIWLDYGDNIIVKAYEKRLKCTVTAAVHFMIGTAARCFEEKHIQTIESLEEKRRIQALVIVNFGHFFVDGLIEELFEGLRAAFLIIFACFDFQNNIFKLPSISFIAQNSIFANFSIDKPILPC